MVVKKIDLEILCYTGWQVALQIYTVDIMNHFLSPMPNLMFFPKSTHNSLTLSSARQINQDRLFQYSTSTATFEEIN